MKNMPALKPEASLVPRKWIEGCEVGGRKMVSGRAGFRTAESASNHLVFRDEVRSCGRFEVGMRMGRMGGPGLVI
jgi:hypothetical protein